VIYAGRPATFSIAAAAASWQFEQHIEFSPKCSISDVSRFLRASSHASEAETADSQRPPNSRSRASIAAEYSRKDEIVRLQPLPSAFAGTPNAGHGAGLEADGEDCIFRPMPRQPPPQSRHADTASRLSTGHADSHFAFFR
jgi:hypothetical protein